MATALTIQKVHWRTLLRTRGELVTYAVNDVLVLDEVNVIVTRPGEDQLDIDENFALQNKQWDFLIDPDTLVDGDDRIVPAQGHVITRADGTRYVVEAAGGSRNCWRWSDALETWRRVHTVIEEDK